MRKPLSLLPVLLILAISLLAACGGPPYSFHGTAYDPVVPAPQLEGVQAGNAPFSLQRLPQKVKLVFFGYTFCPDVCPLTLANMKSVYESLTPDEQSNVAAVFVSVDPERDTPERLRDYVRSFNPAFYGVQVPADALAQVAQAFGVYYAKQEVDSSQSAADYLVDHTAVVYLVDKNDNLRAVYPNDAPSADIVADVQYLLRQ